MTSPDAPVVADDEIGNNLTATGALWLVLLVAQKQHPLLESVSVVTDAQGNATNQIDIGLWFLRSPYRVTVERVAAPDHERASTS